MAARKRKERSPHELVAEEAKEIKALMNEGRVLLEKAATDDEVRAALNVFDRTIAKVSLNSQVPHLSQLQYFRGQCYYRLRDYETAEKQFSEALEQCFDDKNKVPIQNYIGKCKLQCVDKDPSNLEEAIKCFEKALLYSGKTDGEAYYNLGMAYRKQGSNCAVSLAIKHFTSALKYLKVNELFSCYIERGICYRQVDDLSNSIEDFSKACELRKDDPFPYYHLGMNHLISGNYDAGLEKLSLAIELNKYEPQFHNYKGLALYLSGQYQLSLAAFAEALKLYESKNLRNTEVSECLYNCGNALMNLSRQIQALQYFRRATQNKLDNNFHIKISYSQGRTYESLGCVDSIAKFRQCLVLIGDSKSHELYLSALYHLGVNELKHGQNGSAIQSLTRILSDCSEKCVYQSRGFAYMRNQQYELALKDFDQIILLEPDNVYAHYQRGKAMNHLGDLEGALKSFFKSLGLGNKLNCVYNGISEVYLLCGKLEKALVYSNVALEKQPRNADFLIQRSQIYLELNECQKGIDDLSNALAASQKNPLVYYHRGLANYKNKNYEAAIVDLERALKFHPRKSAMANIYFHIGISQANLGNKSEVIEPLTLAISFDPQPKYYHQRAKCYLLLDRHTQALEDLTQVILQQPTNAFAYFRRGFAHKALKLYDQAAEDFMKARELSPNDPRLIINKKQIYQTKYRQLGEAGHEQ